MIKKIEVSKPAVFVQEYTDPYCSGCVHVHSWVDKKMSDFGDIWEVAVDKAKRACQVYILPIISENDTIYNDIFNGAKEKRCPDVKVDGIFTEIKRVTEELSDNKINNCIRNCHKQANHIIVILSSKYNYYRLKQLAKGRFITHTELQVIEFKMANEYILFKRSDFE